jgi:hypothetical protein
MSIVILLIAAAIIIAAATVAAVYYYRYTRIINKRLQGQITDAKKLWAPAKVAVVTAFAGLLLFCVIVLLIRMNSAGANRIDDSYLNALYSYEVYAPEDMRQGYLSNFSIYENAGYKKAEETIQDIKYTYFISGEKFDICHPAFIVFAEYIGEYDIVSYGIQGTYLTTEREPVYGTASSGADAPGYICVIGNASINCVFELSLYYYDEKGTEALNQNHGQYAMTGNSKELASVCSTLNIAVDLE